MSLKRLLYGGLPQLGGGSYQSIVLGIAPASLLAYWPLTETSGTTASDVSGNARHGTYSGVTLAQIAGPGQSMGSAPLFDGVNDFVDIFSASLAAAFNTSTGTYSAWMKVSGAGIWTEEANRAIIDIGVNSNNRYGLLKTTSAFSLDPDINLARGGTASNAHLDTTSTGWLHVGGTWATGANQLIFYLNGAPSSPVAIGGTFSGSVAIASIGRLITLASFWSGYIAHCAVWSTALSAAQITTLATAR